MAVARPSVEGPDYFKRVVRAEEITQKLQANNWDFHAAPDFFSREAACDVVAKEMTLIHDGYMQTRIGRLVIRGVGSMFNLMGPESSLSTFKIAPRETVDEINRQLGSEGLYDLAAFRRLGRPQQLEMFNFTTFFQLRDMVFWSALHETGLSTSGLEYMMRHLAAGKVVHNVLFAPPIGSTKREPVLMQARSIMLQFPTPVVEWMEKPIYGGIAKETIHIENLLTTQPSKVSHPYLPLVAEGRIELCNQQFYLRRFAGSSPKEALGNPGSPAKEAAK